MSGSALMDFLIVVFGICIIYAIFSAGIDLVKPIDEGLKKIGKIAVGGVLVIAFLIAIKNVLFGGGASGLAVTPNGIINFAIGMLVLIAVLYVIVGGIAYLGEAVPFKEQIMFIVAVVALIAILLLAAAVLFGGAGFNIIGHTSGGSLLSR
jgi:hypothetical protein